MRAATPCRCADLAANVHDKWMVAKTLDAVPLRAGRGVRRPHHLCLDKGYDYREPDGDDGADPLGDVLGKSHGAHASCSLVARYGLLRDASDNRTRFRLDCDRYLDVPFEAREISGLLTTFSDDIFSLFVTAMGSDLRIWMEGGHNG